MNVSSGDPQIYPFQSPAGNTLEIGALWSIANKDIPSFERYIAMLKIYYMDYR